VNKKFELSEDSLKVLYIDQEMTSGMIAMKIGCSRRTVSRRLKEFDIPMMRKPEVTQDELIELYTHQRLSCKEIAERTGYRSWTIGRRLKKKKTLQRDIRGKPGGLKKPKKFLKDHLKLQIKGKSK